ncbi:calcium-binding protein [Limnothrix sp. FACHB-881]|uniref:calcium-binding protein n=1 Tax=Limnothrix sp. FACHB-881 TaxID=2692819 RepID=UPI00168391AF|nr:calcium-binding protein [Limnothrix sp. FACHB-881]MBD2635153.1 calcium-binding protein [Limnothrix sp. FACHB-881]
MAIGPNPPFYDLDDTNNFFSTSSLSAEVLRTTPAGVRGLGGDDQITGSAQADIIYGNLGNDSLYGLGGNDTFYGGQGDDLLVGDGLNSTGDDVLSGNKGNDLILGGVGNDILRGGQDNDFLNGEEGNDTLVGDLGQDTLAGGAGDDLLVLRRDTAAVADASGAIAADFIVDFGTGNDRIGLTGGLQESQLQLLAITLTDSGGGSTPSTAITFNDNGVFKTLGLVLGKTPTELAGKFVNTDF